MDEKQIALDTGVKMLSAIDSKLLRVVVALEKIAAHLKHVPEAIESIDLGFEPKES